MVAEEWKQDRISIKSLSVYVFIIFMFLIFKTVTGAV